MSKKRINNSGKPNENESVLERFDSTSFPPISLSFRMVRDPREIISRHICTRSYRTIEQ